MNKIASHQPLTGRVRVLALAALALVSLAAPQLHAEGLDNAKIITSRSVVGNWYVALDAGSFNPNLAGLFLSGLAHFHSDRTFALNDAGDFGAQSFMGPLATTQYGVWKFTGSHRNWRNRRIKGTTLFLEGNPQNGEVMGWTRVQFEIRIVNRNRMEGTINTFSLPCDQLQPLPTPLTCPDPVANAGDFLPSSPPDVPVTFTRIVVGQ